MTQQGFMAPGAYDADSEQIRRRMAYAEMLGQQSQQAPKGQMVGGHFVAPSWTEHAANLLKAYGSGRGQESAMRDMQGLSDRRQGDSMATMQKYGDLLQGTPAQTLQPATTVDDEGNANSPVNVPAQAGNKQAALAQLLQSRDPMLQQFGMQQMMKGPDKPMVVGRSLMTPEGKVIGTDSTWQAEQQAGREAKAGELQLRLEDQRLSREERAATAKELQQIRLDSARELKTLAGSMKPPPPAYFQPVQTANGVMSFNARTGKMEPVNVGGQPVIGAAADPKLQGRIAGEKADAKAGSDEKADAKKAIRKSDQLIDALGRADNLLGMGPTESGVGSIADTAGRFVGVTTKSAQTAAELESLSGWLVANVPRMEGPQSNFDVQNYQTMAGKVGDRTVPVAERKAALKVVQGLQAKYKNQNQEVVGGAEPTSPAAAPPAPTAPKRIRFDAQGNRLP
jgi:hypothetical protein